MEILSKMDGITLIVGYFVVMVVLVMFMKKPMSSDLHPTMKPVSLIARLMKNSSKINGVVLDPFGGSGTTLIACEQLKRKCFMIEFDPIYCDVIIKRWENLTGKKAVKL